MKQKNTLILDDEFIQYCKLNNITDIEKLAKEIFNKGFTLIKYGDRPDMKIEPSEIPLTLKEEMIKKWKDAGLLDGLKPIEKEQEEKIENIIKPNIEQIVKKENDLYDE
jgi:hypothetical protein